MPTSARVSLGRRRRNSAKARRGGPRRAFGSCGQAVRLAPHQAQYAVWACSGRAQPWQLEGSNGGSGRRQRRAGGSDRPGDAEVDPVDEVAGRDQDVRRLDVPVHETVGMGGVQRLGDLPDEVHRARRFQRTTLLEDPADLGAVDQAHVDVQPVLDLAEVVDRDDVRFPKPRRDVRLTPEAPLVLLVVAEDLRQELEGHVPPPADVLRPVHLTHAAGTEEGVEPVVPELPRDQ